MYCNTNKLFQSNIVTRKTKAMNLYPESTSKIMMCIIHLNTFSFLFPSIFRYVMLHNEMHTQSYQRQATGPMRQLLEKSFARCVRSFNLFFLFYLSVVPISFSLFPIAKLAKQPKFQLLLSFVAEKNSCHAQINCNKREKKKQNTLTHTTTISTT